jgi:Holliday junction resolvasome RuvABC endonuclease subunit
MRIERIVDQVNDYAGRWSADLIVLEGPSIMSKGGSNWDRAWLWGSVVETLLSTGIAVVPPTVLKKWAAGKGNADKAAVAVGIARLWEQFECESDNEADALGLASMGSQWLRFGVVPERAHHMECRTKVEWPGELLSAADRAWIADDVRFERTADAADRGGEQ